eukprot:TRINITY_DN30505_c0_g1_i1.p1 TRINITY_DN30505_c0_g1~~TRINITY_DN30505_c0_g1_i1.p1  ORF type:complete len:535 (+),score=118.56 TRINITY_DN30505_c0_g1_i1:41-1606(+)
MARRRAGAAGPGRCLLLSAALLLPLQLPALERSASSAQARVGYVLRRGRDGSAAAAEEEPSLRACFCDENTDDTSVSPLRAEVWRSFREDLHAKLAADPSFTGDWVHRLCGRVYPLIFRVAGASAGGGSDDHDGIAHGACPAGFLTMTVVCAQSAALRQEEFRPGAAVSSGADAALRSGPEPREELQSMMSMAMRALERCFHCLDASPWPLLLEEVLENHGLLVDAPEEFLWRRAAGRLRAPSTWPGPDTSAAGASAASRGGGDDAAAATLALQALSRERRELMRLRIRRAAAQGAEAESLRPVASSPWFESEPSPCGWLLDTLARRRSTASAEKPPRLLSVSAEQPSTLPHLECDLRSTDKQERVVPAVVVATNGRGPSSIAPNPDARAIRCAVEELHLCFPPAYFDIAYVRSALDRCDDPLLGLEALLRVLRPGGWALLRHRRDASLTRSRPWSFEAVEEETGGGTRFVVRSSELEADLTTRLLRRGLAVEVRTARRGEEVWVEVRKPTPEEAATRHAA